MSRAETIRSDRQALHATDRSSLDRALTHFCPQDLMPVDGLAEFVSLCHKHGLKVKLYFTTRELSNRCAEIFA